MMSIVHDMAEADVGDITPEHASGVTKAQKAKLEEVMCGCNRLLGLSSDFGSMVHLGSYAAHLPSTWPSFYLIFEDQEPVGGIRGSTNSREQVCQGPGLV